MIDARQSYCAAARASRAWDPATSSSLAEETTARTISICSLRSLRLASRAAWLSTAGTRFPTLAADDHAEWLTI